MIIVNPKNDQKVNYFVLSSSNYLAKKVVTEPDGASYTI